ncbi:MAG TPA: DUF6349 family protein [Solirubrobacterales bacterium]|nr:DUF6349 family protein [Solirubrobacterales bacterium]
MIQAEMAEKSPEIHIADVKVLKRGYAAACSTCDWVGPEHDDPDAAVEDAKAHEENPKPERNGKVIQLRKIRRRL